MHKLERLGNVLAKNRKILKKPVKNQAKTRFRAL
jgi:hypothetical protein